MEPLSGRCSTRIAQLPPPTKTLGPPLSDASCWGQTGADPWFGLGEGCGQVLRRIQSPRKWGWGMECPSHLGYEMRILVHSWTLSAKLLLRCNESSSLDLEFAMMIMGLRGMAPWPLWIRHWVFRELAKGCKVHFILYCTLIVCIVAP